MVKNSWPEVSVGINISRSNVGKNQVTNCHNLFTKSCVFLRNFDNRRLRFFAWDKTFPLAINIDYISQVSLLRSTANFYLAHIKTFILMFMGTGLTTIGNSCEFDQNVKLHTNRKDNFVKKYDHFLFSRSRGFNSTVSSEPSLRLQITRQGQK